MTDNLLVNNPLMIVDVGASGGIQPRWAKFTSFYKGILFEPDSKEYDILKSKSGQNLIVLNSALSDSNKEIDFFLCEKQEASSIYLPNTDFLNKFPDANRYNVTKKIGINTDTLDNQLRKNDIVEVDFIKIDTQGSELPILKGGLCYLERTIGLELEVLFSPLYKNQPSFNEVDNFVRKRGFDLFDIRRCYWKRKEYANNGNQKGQLVFGDALYFRTPESVLSMTNITREKILRAICVYLVYGYSDLAHTLFNSAESLLNTTELQDAISKILVEFKKKNLIPDFIGKGRIKIFLEKIARKFRVNQFYSGTDTDLGNM